METLGKYELVGTWSYTANGAVCRATRGARRYVVKRLPVRFPDEELKEYPAVYRRRYVRAAKVFVRENLMRYLLIGSARAGACAPVDVIRKGCDVFTVTRFARTAQVSGERLTSRNVCRLLEPASIDHLLVSILRQQRAFARLGFVHNDLKPANVVICEARPGVYEGRIIDLDSGFFCRLAVPEPGETVGALEYASPEYLRYIADTNASARRSGIGCASDVFSLGVLFYEYLTGRPLCDDERRWPGNKIVQGRPLRIHGLDRRHKEIVESMLLRDPVLRPDADELIKALGG